MVDNATENWPAAKTWRELSYMQSQIKLSQAANYAYTEWGLEDIGAATEEQNAQLATIKEVGHGGLYFPEDRLPHFQALIINYNDNLKKDIELPPFIKNTLKLLDISIASEHESVNEDLNGYANQVGREIYRCIVTGSQDSGGPAAKIRLVSPIFKQNMYSGSRVELKPHMSPIDLFHAEEDANLETFPLLLETQLHHYELEVGQCIFIPAYWWVQHHTLGETDALIVDFEFEPHSELFRVINDGLEYRQILEAGPDETHAPEDKSKSQAKVGNDLMDLNDKVLE